MRFVAIDVETANSDMASICQIGLAKFTEGELVDEWVSIIDPEDDFDWANVDVHGITERDVDGEPTLLEVVETLRGFMEDTICVCHTHFDRVSISRAFEKYEIPALNSRWLDTAKVARRTWKEFSRKGYDLGNVCNHIGYSFKHHDALEDAKASAKVLLVASELTGLAVEDWLKRVKQPIDPSNSSSSSFVNSESKDHRHFCGRKNLKKAINTLRGILNGVTADGVVNAKEIQELRCWVSNNEEFSKYCPFNELIPLVQRTMEDGVVDEEELEDVRWFLRRAASDNDYYDSVTCDLQSLQGVLHGILADGEINQAEIETLSRWVDDHEHLVGCYPYDEIHSLLLDVMEDRKVDEKEIETMKAFFSEFVNLEGGAKLEVNPEARKQMTRAGVCAVNPNIEFRGRIFCFTGESNRGTKAELGVLVEGQGGRHHSRVVKDLDYLVVGGKGNPAWVFCCYGRKIEQVVKLRKLGKSALIVHENDFWKAVENTR